MNPQVEISIINLCYNTGRFLSTTYESIKSQTFQNFELIIVDDCSTDDSVLLIEKWLIQNPVAFTVVFLKNEKNLGIPKSLNLGLSYAKGRYYAMIGDDRWDPMFLETVHSVISQTPKEIATVYTKARVLSVASDTVIGELNPFWDWKRTDFPNKQAVFQKNADKLYRLPCEVLQEYLFYANPIVSFTMLMKMDAVKNTGIYNDNYPDEDFPAWFTLARQYDFLFVDTTLATYIRHENSFTIKNTYTLTKGHLAVLIENADLARSSAAKRQLCKALFNYWLELNRTWATNWREYRFEAISITLRLIRFSNGVRLPILRHCTKIPSRRFRQLFRTKTHKTFF